MPFFRAWLARAQEFCGHYARLVWSWARASVHRRIDRIVTSAVHHSPPLRYWIALGAFMLTVMMTTVFIGVYSSRARAIFVKIAQAALVKYTGYQVYIVDTQVDFFPPRVQLDGVIARRVGERPFFVARRIAVMPGITRSIGGSVALEWLEVRSPEVRLTYKNGGFEELSGLTTSSGKADPTKTRVPFELWGALITKARVQINIPGKAVIDVKNLNAFAAPRARGSIPVEVVVPPVTIELPNRRVVLENVRLGLHVKGGNLLAPKRVSVRTLEFVSDAASVSSAGNVDMDKQQGSLTVKSNVDLAILQALFPELPPFAGRAAFSAEIDSEGDRPTVQLDVDATGLAAGSIAIGDMHAEVVASSDRVEVKQLLLRTMKGEVSVTGTLKPRLDYPFDAFIRWGSIDVADVLDTLGVKDPWVSVHTEGRAKVTGHLLTKGLSDPVLTGTAHIDVKELLSRDRSYRLKEFKTILALKNATVDTKLSLYSDRLELEDAVVAGDPGRLDVNVRFYFDQILGFHINGESDLLDLKKLGPIAGVNIEGAGPLIFELGGPYGPPRIEARVSMENTKVQGIVLGHVDSEVVFQDQHTLEFPDAVATLGETQVDGSGKIDLLNGPRFDFTGSLEEGDIKDLIPLMPIPALLAKNLSGDIGGGFHLFGLASAPSLDIGFASDGFEVLGQPFETAIGKLAMKEGRLEQMTIGAKLGAGDVDVEINGATTPNGPISIHADLADVPTTELRFLQAARKSLDGKLTARVDVQFGKDPIGDGAVQIDDLKIAGRPPVSINGTMRLKGERIGYDLEAMNGKMTVKGTADIGDEPEFQFEGALKNAGIGGLLGLPSDYETVVSGAVTLGGPFNSLDRLSGQLVLDQVRIDAPTLAALSKQRSKLTLAERKLQIEGLELLGQGVDLAIKGFVALDGKLNVSFTGLLDGKVLQPFVPRTELIAGSVPLDVRLSGAIAQPELRGTAKLEDLRLKFAFFDRTFEDLSGEVTLSGDTFAFDNLSAGFGDGTVSGSGSVKLAEGDLQNLSFAFDLDRVHYTVPGDLPLVASGRLRIDTNRAKQFEITGEAHVSDLRYTYDLNLDAMMPSFRRKPTLTRTLDKNEERVLFDVHVISDENVIIDNNIAKAELKADVRVTGTNLRPGLVGTLTPVNAQFYVQNHTFTLTSGTIDFIERYQVLPRVDMRLRTKACAAEIGVSVSGTADNYVMDFSGRDAKGIVPEGDIKSCLAFGFRQSEFSQGAGVNAGSAQEVLPVGLNFLGSVTGLDRKLKEYFRIDEVRFGTGYTQKVGRGSRYSTRIILVKDVAGGVKLRFTSSITESDDQRVELEFPLDQYSTMNLSWGNSGDLSNDLGLDLKWRKEF
ncbi:MAG: translocation/assembly module TamB domain-containing protein [Deltaproteobacteria bacterium]|nr:translocation/assembly module TamB domain-containing protein [Deltaproteobacteria bacterium]